MNIEEKTNIKRAFWALLFFSLVAVIPNAVLGIVYSVPSHSQVLLKTDIKITQENKPVVAPTQTTANITIPMIIATKPTVKKENTKQWICGPPRDLEMGSGTVKECEWK